MTTMSTNTSGSIEPLLQLLARVRRQARAWIWVESLAILTVAAAAIFWTTLAIDWLIEPPAWARATAVAMAGAVLLWLVATRLIGRLAAPLSDRALALAVERRIPRCGDTLSTAVALAEGADETVDHDLASRTTAAATMLAGEVSTPGLFRRGRLLATALVGGIAAGSVAWLVAAEPAAATLWARRVVLLEDTPWPRRVSLEAEGFLQGIRKVARGSDVDLVVRVSAEGPLPEVVELRSRAGDNAWQTVRMGMRGSGDSRGQVFGHLLEAVGDDLQIEIQGGDARLRGLVLDVVEPPALAAATIHCTLPAYLGGGRRELPASRVVPVPRGSQVEVSLAANKPLAVARLVGRFAGEPAETPNHSAGVGDATAGDERTWEASREAGRTGAEGGEAGRLLKEHSAHDNPTKTIDATIPSLDADCTLVASFTDTDGITNREPITLVLSAIPDEAPRVAVRLDCISTAVTPQARLPIVGTLSDDHGLAEATVSLAQTASLSQSASRTQPEAAKPLVVSVGRVRGGEPIVELPVDRPEVVSLGPVGLKVGDRATVVVSARDRCTLAGGPNVGSGETWTLEVVTPEALQAMLEAREVLLRRRYEAAIEDLSQARRGLDDVAGADNTGRPADRLAESTARCIGETDEIAMAFRGMHAEFANNDLLTPELEARLLGQIADPLAAVAAGPLVAVAEGCRRAATGELPLAMLATWADLALASLRAVLARLLELESFNEVVEKLRGVIEAQEAIRRDTLERQRQRARELLE